MKYQESLKQLTEVTIPQTWENVLRAEKTAELLVYNVLCECMRNFCDISVVVSLNNPVNAVLRSWYRDETNSFGSNAIFLKETEYGDLILGCKYDMYKLKEDLELFATELFGNLDPVIYSDKNMEKDIEISDMELSGIQRKRIPLNQNK